MCRISGLINNSIPSRSKEEMVEAMCEIQKHGGPDDGGIYVSPDNGVIFGNRRLALMDLSVAGHQPMIYRQHLVITYNGELYNFQELAAELTQCGHSFRSHSDTEVILAAFDQWGEKAFSRFRGMFAFAIYDEIKKKVFLVRDTSGIKPLYYSTSFQSLVFASETRAFRAINLPFSEDPHWQILLMAYGHIPEPSTTIREVKMLEKGTYLSYDCALQKAQIYSYSHYSFSFSGEKDQASVKERLNILLKRSVKRHLLADAPVGIFLSGGLDSSLLYSLALSSGKGDIKSLSIYFDEPGFSEKVYQDRILEFTAGRGMQFKLGVDDFIASFPAILADMDMPACDGLNTWFICKYARQSGLKGVLSGIGADELFGGYPSFTRIQKTLVLQKIPGFLLKAAAGWAAGKYERLAYLSIPGITGTYLFLRGHFVPRGIADYLGADEKQVWDILENHPRNIDTGWLRSGNLASWMELNMYMQNQLLRDADVMSMKHGVEVRVPFLDEELIRLALATDPSVKFPDRLSKQLLINTFSDTIPSEIWKRPKMGFSLPYGQWLKKNPFAMELMQSGGERNRKVQDQFQKNEVSWSQYLSVLMIQNAAHA